MRFLLDTNVVSELRKNERCDPAVSAWARHELAMHGGAVSVLVLGEIRKGIAMLARRDPPAASRLESWLQGLTAGYGDRILPITSEIAAEWGRMNSMRSLPARPTHQNALHELPDLHLDVLVVSAKERSRVV